MPFFHHIIIYNENVLLICNLYYIHNSYIHGLGDAANLLI